MARPPEDDEFTAYVTARWGPLYRTAYLLVGEHALAEDLVQTALAKTYAAWGRIKVFEAADAYVHKTLVTTAMGWWRRKSWQGEKPRDDVPDLETASGPGHEERLGQRDWVWREIEKLPPRQRAVVVLRYYEDLSERQIAAAMDCSVGTVKSQAHEALARLRKTLGDDVVPDLANGGTR